MEAQVQYHFLFKYSLAPLKAFQFPVAPGTAPWSHAALVKSTFHLSLSLTPVLCCTCSCACSYSELMEAGRAAGGSGFSFCLLTSLALSPPSGITSDPFSWLLSHPHYLQAPLQRFQLSSCCRATFGKMKPHSRLCLYKGNSVWKVLWPGQSQLAQVDVWVGGDRSGGSFLAHVHQPEGVS